MSDEERLGDRQDAGALGVPLEVAQERVRRRDDLVGGGRDAEVGSLAAYAAGVSSGLFVRKATRAPPSRIEATVASAAPGSSRSPR